MGVRVTLIGNVVVEQAEYERMTIEAHELSRLATSSIENHEEICAERYNGIHGSLDNLHASLLEYQRKESVEWGKLYSRMWTATTTIIILLLSGFGTLVWYIMTHEFAK